MLGRQGIVLKLSEKAKNKVAEMGYDPQFGARPLKRVIQRELVNELSKLVLAGTFSNGDTIYVDESKGTLVFTKEPFPESSNTVEAPSENGKSGRKRRRGGSKKEKNLEALKKATKEVEDAVKGIKKDNPPKPAKEEDGD